MAQNQVDEERLEERPRSLRRARMMVAALVAIGVVICAGLAEVIAARSHGTRTPDVLWICETGGQPLIAASPGGAPMLGISISEGVVVSEPSRRQFPFISVEPAATVVDRVTAVVDRFRQWIGRGDQSPLPDDDYSLLQDDDWWVAFHFFVPDQIRTDPSGRVWQRVRRSSRAPWEVEASDLAQDW